ncbi:MAG TPA: hypothetical protein VFQ35_13920, partial [Polyangiaceae bacterium]|nr:hypothetical protein [Polyangiaceae bacterium]
MRLALLVGSAYEKNGRVASIPSAEIDEGLIERRLCEPDADFKVLRFAAERGLAERIEQRLVAQTEPITELLVYFSGYSVLSEERGPALLLDGERLGTLSLTRLRNLFLVHSTSSCLIVDAAAVVDANQSLGDVASAIGATLTSNAPSISALVAVRNSAVQDSFGGSAFTGMMLTALDWLAASRDEAQAIHMGELYSALSSDESAWKEIPAAGLFGDAPAGFTILPAAAVVAATPPSARAPSPSFETVRPLDEVLGHPTLPPEEPKTQPGVAAFDAPDEITPTHPHAPSSMEEPPLPSFELAGEHDADAPLPSFGLDESTEPHRLPLASEDGSGTRLVPKATVLGVLAEGEQASSDASFESALSDHSQERARHSEPVESASATEAEHAEESDDPDEIAVRELEAALTRTRDTSERATILARLARLLARVGRGERASVLFVEATQRDPLNIEVLMLRGEWAEAARDTANLMHAAEMWLGVAPNDVRALILLGKAAERAGDARRSIDARLRAAEHGECSPEDRRRALRAAARLVRSELADFDWAEKLDECARTGARLDAEESSQAAPLASEPLREPRVVAEPEREQYAAPPEAAESAPLASRELAIDAHPPDEFFAKDTAQAAHPAHFTERHVTERFPDAISGAYPAPANA